MVVVESNRCVFFGSVSYSATCPYNDVANDRAAGVDVDGGDSDDVTAEFDVLIMRVMTAVV